MLAHVCAYHVDPTNLKQSCLYLVIEPYAVSLSSWVALDPWHCTYVCVIALGQYYPLLISEALMPCLQCDITYVIVTISKWASSLKSILSYFQSVKRRYHRCLRKHDEFSKTIENPKNQSFTWKPFLRPRKILATQNSTLEFWSCWATPHTSLCTMCCSCVRATHAVPSCTTELTWSLIGLSHYLVLLMTCINLLPTM